MIFLYILGSIVVVLFLLFMISPKSYHVSRSIEVQKSKPEVYQALKSLAYQDKWSVWASRDPHMTKELRGTDGEIGAVSYWNGNKEVGEGEQEITGLYENRRVETQLRFLKPWKSQSDAYFDIEDKNGLTKVTWGFQGENPPAFRIPALFMNMDKMIGKDFEQGLANFKEFIEA